MSRSPLPIILLVGAPRSGASLLAQILSIMGLDPGRSLVPPSVDNPQGVFENEKIVEVHDKLLEALDRDWTTACFLTGEWMGEAATHNAVDQLVEIIRSDFSRDRASLIKDPRLAALYPLWLQVAKKLGRKIKVIGAVRSVDRTAMSLTKRNRLEPDVAELVAMSYMSSASDVFTQSKAKIISYEALTIAPAEEIVEQLASFVAPVPAITAATTIDMVERLVLPPSTSGLASNAQLQDLHDQHIGVSRLTLTLNRVAKFAVAAGALTEFGVRKKTHAQHKSFLAAEKVGERDVLERMISLNKEVFSAEQANETLNASLEAKNEELGALTHGISERDNEIGRLHHEAAALKERISALEDGVLERDGALEKLRAEIGNTSERIGALDGGIAERDAALAKLNGDLAEKQRGIDELQSSLAEQDGSLDTIRTEFEERGSQLLVLNEHLANRDAELSTLRVAFASGEKKLRSLQNDAQHKGDQLSNLQAQIDEKNEALQGLESGLIGHNEKIANLNDQLRDKSNKVSDLEADMTEKEALLEQLHLEIEQKERTFDAQKRQLLTANKNDVAQQAKVLASLRKTVETREDEMSAQQEALEIQSEELAILKSSIESRLEKIMELEAGTSQLTAEILSLKPKLASRAVQISALEAELQAHTERVQKLDQLLFEANERNRMMEDQHRALNNRLEYFDKYTVRAAVKSVLFSSMRAVKRALPIPKSAQMALSRRARGVSRRLRPAHLVGPAKSPGPSDADDPGGGGHRAVALVPPGEINIDFEFAAADAPIISVIVPVYNEIAQTIACLRSVSQQQVSVPYEVILADDASPDPDHEKFQDIKGLRYHRSAENLGFLLNCNTHAEHARGEYIVFLNNDTLVHAGWMEALYQTFHAHGNVGVVGSKLIFPNGELQEAGGIIWNDASGWNWGRGQHADHPRYNFVRDVDYVSGAALMVRTDLFREIGGFYTGLEHAYYEDADCCFRIREKGYRVVYQPRSVVTHIEGLSSGTDLKAGAKKYQLSNQKIFRDTWQHVLSADHFESSASPALASDRTAKGHILYIDAITPTPDQDSGSLDAFNAMSILTGLGYRVHFIPGTNFAHAGEATKKLQALGVECIYHPFYSDMASFLKDRGDTFDFVILSRAEINDMFLDKIKKSCPSAKLIYNTVDLHFLRQQREAELAGNEGDKKSAEAMRSKELAFMRKTDATIILSEHERDVLGGIEGIEDKLFNIPLIREESQRVASFENSRDIAFIGGYNHPPNVDAVEWLVSEIWPQVRSQMSDVKLLICGSAMPDSFKDYAADDIEIKGYIPNLETLLSTTRLTVAPLRYGAGLKGKVASSIGAGVPCIGTPIAFEGMAQKDLQQIKLEAQAPEEFASLIAEIYNDSDRWNLISDAGTRYHNENYGKPAISALYNHLLESLNS